MTEKEQLQFLNNQMTECIGAIKRIQVVLIGDEFNPNGIVQAQEIIKKDIESIKQYQLQQKTGISLGKWVLGTSLGAFILSQFSHLQQWIRQLLG